MSSTPPDAEMSDILAARAKPTPAAQTVYNTTAAPTKDNAAADAAILR